MRFALDVNERRAALQGLVRLYPDNSEELALDKVELDTGSAWGMSGPAGAVPASLLESAPLAFMRVMGGHRLCVKRVEVSIRIDGHDFDDRLEVALHHDFDCWLIGMPFLRRFHLLLAHERLLTADELGR